ncbi:MAG: hypothetical protein A3J63_03385 [Candidatus Moranbacteria bacterium RIFCSPHIGHO2_02_FULL_40_12b]|nr:MAG: hypothetical protein A3J63_03385 [Candidatus Moranbacteria bacterium RIFCSPHIGHO2_02_FULL_40_12b]
MNAGKKILLVEDDVFVSDVYQTKLKQEGFEVISAENGSEAMKKLETVVPDIILLDIIMPYMDGKEVLARLKESEKWKNIPVIILTNLSQRDDVEEILQKGADDYLIKSHFTPSEVVEKIKAVLDKTSNK